MASQIPTPLRIVCTKCVRIVRVLFQETQPWSDVVLIAAVCCKRWFGHIHGETLKARIHSDSLTTADIEQHDDKLEEFAADQERRASEAKRRAGFARWAAGALDVPPQGDDPAAG